jgi:ABC-type dipeptide/oligopeptide/nickel transport system permease component
VLSYLLRRLAQSIVVVAAVVVLVFGMMFLSGDPAALLMPPDASREEIEAFRHEMGFDQPFWMQLAKFSGNLLVGDFGRSWRFQEPALSVVLERLPATFELAIAALVLSLLIALPVGVLSAVRKDSKVDTISMVLALLGQSVPGFWLGLMLILIFAVDLGWLPTSGRNGPQYLILPAVSLALALAGRNARLVRSCMLEVLNADYIRTARAKGLPEWRVIGKHALKNAMLPIVTIVGLELGSLLGGAVVTETVFSWPGIGLLAVQAIAGRDYPVVQAVIIISALGFVLINLAVDLLYARLDPRVTLIQPQGA